MNYVFLSGYLAADGKLIGNVTPACALRLAVNRRVRDASGTWKDEASFFDVYEFGKRAPYTAERAKKGDFIEVVGRVAQSKQQGKGIFIVATDTKILSKSDRQASTSSQSPTGGSVGEATVDAEDVPF